MMTGSALPISHASSENGVFARNSRANWIGSKIMQAIGVEADRMDAVHHAMMLLILHEGGNAASAPTDECEHLAAQIVAVARVAEKAATDGGPNAAIAAVMHESGRSIDPLLAQNFLRLASSPIFWMALDSAGRARPS